MEETYFRGVLDLLVATIYLHLWFKEKGVCGVDETNTDYTPHIIIIISFNETMSYYRHTNFIPIHY